MSLTYFNEYKERVFYRIDQLEAEIAKLHGKCDEFYRHNCELRREINGLVERLNQVKGGGTPP